MTVNVYYLKENITVETKKLISDLELMLQMLRYSDKSSDFVNLPPVGETEWQGQI